MRKIATIIVFVAVIALLGTGCDLSLNLFSGMGLPEYDAAEIDSKADSDPSGALDDIETMIETEQVTNENRSTVLSALDKVYASTSATTEEKQTAAYLSGQLEITGDEGANTVVSNTSSLITEVLNSDGNLTDDQILSALTSGLSDMSNSEFDAMFTSFGNAAADYNTNFLGTSPSTNDYLSDGEKGDLLIMSTVSIVLSDIHSEVTSTTDLYNVIRGQQDYSTLSFSNAGYSPTDNFDTSTDPNSLMQIIDYADTSGDIYNTLASM